jgi:hypothetical protein
MIQQIPFDIIEKPFEYKDIKIKNGYQLHLTKDFDFNEIEVGSCPFYLITLGHNFVLEPVMIYTFFVGENNEIFLESEAISSSEWITQTNQPDLTGFIWPNIDSYLMHGFQPSILFVLEELTNNRLIDPIMNIRTRTYFE